jgi:hypothetical protein
MINIQIFGYSYEIIQRKEKKKMFNSNIPKQNLLYHLHIILKVYNLYIIHIIHVPYNTYQGENIFFVPNLKEKNSFII